MSLAVNHHQIMLRTGLAKPPFMHHDTTFPAIAAARKGLRFLAPKPANVLVPPVFRNNEFTFGPSFLILIHVGGTTSVFRDRRCLLHCRSHTFPRPKELSQAPASTGYVS